jgi:hypothetical protein
MNQPLFISTELSFEKTATGGARLSENADTWPEELMQELSKQHPYLGDYDTSPVMVEVDGDRGYGLGYFEVQNKSARRALGPGGEALKEMEGIQSIRVPIIIEEATLKPLDVFFAPDKTAQGLTEERIRATLYRPHLFDTTAAHPPGVSLVDQLYPPSSGGRGFGTGALTESPNIKTGSAESRFLMPALAPTILRSDIEAVKSAIVKEANLLPALLSNENTLPFMELLQGVEPTTAEDVAKVASRYIPPDVVQIRRQGEAYVIKQANSQMFAPSETEADRFTTEEQVGQDLVTTADQLGAVTVSTNPVVRETAEDERIETVDKFGYYRVKTIEGKELVGWVFPTVLDYSGVSLPMMLFTNGAVSAIQPEIVGSFAGQHTNIIRGKPEGHGFFYRVTDNGSVVAFIPSECKGAFRDENGAGFVIESLGGDFVGRIRPTPGFEGIQELGEGEVAIPGDVRWAPLEAGTTLMDDPELFAKTASLKHRRNAVRIVSDGKAWSFQGPPLRKLAADQINDLSGADAHFLAVTLGMTPEYAAMSLVKSAKENEVSIRGCREINTPREKLAEARTEAEGMMGQLPKKHLLLKEAATLQDMTTIDKVLSIGFINPENVQMFVEFIPDFEETHQRLAQTLIACRMGIPDIPETAVKSAMERLDEVIVGLKKLVYRQGPLEA